MDSIKPVKYNSYSKIVLINKNVTKKKEVSKTWISGPSSCTLIIPKSLAKSHGLDKPSHVLIEDTENGILIRKLEL